MAVSAERGQLSRLWPPVRFEPRTHRLRGWMIDFPSQVPRRLLDYPELKGGLQEEGLQPELSYWPRR